MATVTREMLEAGAKALNEAMFRLALEELQEAPIDCDEIDQVLEEALEQSDRGAAILIFSYIETVMHRVFSLHLDGKIKGGLKSILDNNGPLGTASSRIKMLHALGWIDTETAAGLDLVRSIRNHFAHEVSARSFDDKKIKGWVTSLPPLEKNMENLPGLEGVYQRENGLTTRHLFLARAIYLAWNLVNEAYAMPYSKKFRIHPKTLIADLNRMPENLKNANRSFSRISLMIIGDFAPEIYKDAEKILKQSNAEAKAS